MKKVLVTGGSGQIGSIVIKKLLSLGYQVRITDLQPCDADDAEYIKGDVTSLNDMIAATEGIDAVIHLAAIPVETGNAEKIFHINTLGTFNVLEACARNNVKGLVLASSVLVYGVVDSTCPEAPHYLPVDEEYPIVPERNYGMSKVIGESICQSYCRRYKMNCISLRIASVLFPESQAWKDAVAAIDNPEYELVPGLPMSEFMWQYVHADDAAEAFCLAVKRLEQKDTGFEVFNIGAEDIFSSHPSMEIIGKYLPDVPKILRPAEFAADKQRALYDISKARAVLGYKPGHTWRELA